ncbi:MAG: branched-chain amino acid ABC transporter permease [bacterium]|jgi:ABC-type branched-subunit amino acid transport system permease subunit
MINGYFETIIILILVNIIFAQSLNLILGFNGQFSLGHAAFLAIGAYTSAILVGGFGMPLPVGVICGGLLAAILGLLTGVPALRLRGDYLAIATLGFGEIVIRILLILPPAYFGGATGVPGGASKIETLPQLKNVLAWPGAIAPEYAGKAIAELSGAPPANINQAMNLVFAFLWIGAAAFLLVYGLAVLERKLSAFVGRRFGVNKPALLILRVIYMATLATIAVVNSRKLNNAFYSVFELQKARSWSSYLSSQWTVFLLLIGVVTLVIWLFRNYLRSIYGRAVIAIREDEMAGTMLGINLFKFKLMNFLIGSFFAGVAGGLLAHSIPSFNPYEFNFFKSVEVLLMVVLGGMGSLTGTIIGSTVITILPEAFRAVGQWRMVIYSLALVFLMIFRPGGLFGQSEFAFQLPKFLRRAPAAGSADA